MIPIHCIGYSKLLVNERFKVLLVLYNAMLIMVSHTIFFVLDGEYFIIAAFTLWVVFWNAVPLIIRVASIKFASCSEGESELIPAYVSIGNKNTPVWFQNRWSEGEYSEFIVKNGCGHCCAAMALNLHGVKTDPHEVFALCRQLWGEPKEHQGNYQTVSGIVKILEHYGVPAYFCGVPTRERAAKRIEKALRRGRQVIFWSRPSEDFPENPFSTGGHYVLAVGYTKEGEILIANSSEKSAPTGVQTVDIDTIARALYLDSKPKDMTWGERDRHINCAGYVVVEGLLF